MGGRSFGDYELADMTTTAYPQPPYLDSSSGGRDFDLDSSGDDGVGGSSSGGLKASDFVFPSDLASATSPIPSSTTSDDIDGSSSQSSIPSPSQSSSPAPVAGMTKFQLQMSGQWNQQVGTNILLTPNHTLLSCSLSYSCLFILFD